MAPHGSAERRGTSDSCEAADLIGCSTVIGEMVRNLAGEELGEIRELMLDARGGCVAYAVLSFGGLMGLGRKLFPVPWKALQFGAEDGRVLLDIPRSHLEHAPGFNKDDWPNLADRALAASVHDYYHLSPYWETSERS